MVDSGDLHNRDPDDDDGNERDSEPSEEGESEESTSALEDLLKAALESMGEAVRASRDPGGRVAELRNRLSEREVELQELRHDLRKLRDYERSVADAGYTRAAIQFIGQILVASLLFIVLASAAYGLSEGVNFLKARGAPWLIYQGCQILEYILFVVDALWFIVLLVLHVLELVSKLRKKAGHE